MRKGGEMPLSLEGETGGRRARAAVLSLRKETEMFRFVDVPAAPVPSLGRDFSAPVIIDYDYGDEALQHPAELRQRSVQPLGSRAAAMR